jgi:uncharacterized protein (TIGR04255 family)
MPPDRPTDHPQHPPPAPLAEFDRPPVVEVALGVQFNPLVALTSTRLGLLWARFRDRYPVTEEHAPLASVTEEFGPPREFSVDLQVHAVGAPPPPRCWFINEASTHLIQVQQDRFVCNWRKRTEEDEYPRYGRLREAFAGTLAEFMTFLADEQLGELVPNQCELTYIDHIPLGEGWDRFGQLDRVLAVWSGRHSDSYLPEPEDVTTQTRYVIRDEGHDPIGRLHFTAKPAVRRADGVQLLVLTAVARGRPLGDGVDGVLRFLDTGHEWVARGFVSLTTPHMHALWGRHG